MSDATPDIQFQAPLGTGQHAVQPGETTDSLAETYGHFWKTIWTHPDNAVLVSARNDRNVLLQGDQVFIPDKRPKSESRPTDLIHRFVRKGVPARIKLRALAPDGTPLTNCDYILRVGTRRYEGKSDADGIIDQSVAPSAQTGQLTVYPAQEDMPKELHWSLTIGSLQPVDTVLGIQARLQNLGYDPGALDGQLGPATRKAIGYFRLRNNLPDGTAADQQFVDALEKQHGS
ncbi:MAG: hypothetical protein CMM78_09215 [Rhodospirillaceae bacterium]|jgi:N-acetylmuramoyl-L-alanine amidase|nr:hypothetical protein [Rhodospirillales bacterium]MAX48374.1 hypothetical protein [Rhodospirillaceae bacterium]|tara:strand:- start:68894 stop:69586 length:693 start_codon:yes stop_codon:yes gene_type:complete